MTDMVRKQVYIHQRQEATLKRLARQRGLSEAEIIRQAIDREAVAQLENWIQAFPVYDVTQQIVLEAGRGAKDHNLAYYDAQI